MTQPSKRALEARLGAIEHSQCPRVFTSITLTPDVNEAILDILQCRRELAATKDGQPIEFTPKLVPEALDHMDDDLTKAIRLGQ